MPRLIPPELGNGKRPSDPLFASSMLASAVPMLDVSDDTHDLVGQRHGEALDPDHETGLLLGAVVMLDNPRPVPGEQGHVIVHIAGSTLHEAATEVVRAFSVYALHMPEWVASTDAELADVLAEHFTVDGYSTCRVIDLSEVPS